MDKPVLIIIEGCDNTGKTTLAHHIEDFCLDFGWHSVMGHLGKPSEEDQKDIYQWHLDHLEKCKSTNPDVIILDRFHLSNMCYGSIMGHSNLTLDQLIKLEKKLLKDYSVGMIYCYDAPQLLEKDWDDPMIEKSQILQILTAYQFLLNCSILPIVSKTKLKTLDISELLHVCTVGSIMASTEVL